MSLPWMKYWDRLRSALEKLKRIPNWTRDSGEIGDDFQAVAEEHRVLARLPAGGVRTIYYGEMEYIYNQWEGYLAGKVPRGRLATKSLNSKYIISIFHKFQHLM